jgi:hypothetical protein
MRKGSKGSGLALVAREISTQQTGSGYCKVQYSRQSGWDLGKDIESGTSIIS